MVCNIRDGDLVLVDTNLNRNPLTGLGGLQPVTEDLIKYRNLNESQSPYGAKWFATNKDGKWVPESLHGRNPLTGLSGLQLKRLNAINANTSRNPLTGLSGLQQGGNHALCRLERKEVAIPLRG